MLTKTRAQKRLATLWFIGAGALFLLLLLQTFFGRYGEQTQQAWTWFLPTIMPSLSLITGAVATDAMGRSDPNATVDPFPFRVAFILSAAYLVIVSLTVLLSPFSPLSQIELMELSNLWLGPLQGLVGGVLGFFFVSRPKAKSAPAG